MPLATCSTSASRPSADRIRGQGPLRLHLSRRPWQHPRPGPVRRHRVARPRGPGTRRGRPQAGRPQAAGALELAVGRPAGAGLQVDDDATALVPLESVDPAVEPGPAHLHLERRTRRPPARARWPAARRRVAHHRARPLPLLVRMPRCAEVQPAQTHVEPAEQRLLREVMRQRRGVRTRVPRLCWAVARRATDVLEEPAQLAALGGFHLGRDRRAAPRHAPAGRRTGAPARTTTTGRRPEPRPGRDRRGVRRRPPAVAHRSPGRRRRCVARPPGRKGRALWASV